MFWNGITVRPDIVIEKGIGEDKQTFVIDTKWKNISDSQPSTDDLRQMYVYNEYWQSDKAMLLCPSNISTFEEKDFKKFNAFEGKTEQHACGLGKISIVESDSITLDKEIGSNILEWFNRI